MTNTHESASRDLASWDSADDQSLLIDPSRPLGHCIVCCTSIPPDQRTEIASKVEELGGIHKYDLTPDVTHLIVGDYDTPKYRHVARERPDITAMDAAWVEAMAQLWKNDQEIAFAALEREHRLKALEKSGAEAPSTERQPLLICLTGFGEQRDEIASKIVANGGKYTGDLTRRCTHLIVSKPEGKKFNAAKSWNIHTVTLDWLHQSVERGMILEEAKFDPLLPAEQQGVGAWIRHDPRRQSMLKRSRSSASAGAEDRGGRKLRKTASMKLNTQQRNLWGDILGRPGSRESSVPKGPSSASQPDQATPEPTIHQPRLDQQLQARQDDGVFSKCVFAIHGFNDERHMKLEDTITTLCGSVSSSVREAATSPSFAEYAYRFLVVPQKSQPATHPSMPYDNVNIVTEFFIEQCLHNKRFVHPNERVLGRPFPLFPIPGFSDLVICSAAFTGLELNQIARSISQLGARFEEEFRPTTSVLVCRSLSAMRKDKLKYALEWGVPVVPAEWLWECISTGFLIPIGDSIFAELKHQYRTPPTLAAPGFQKHQAASLMSSVSGSHRAREPKTAKRDAPRTQNPAGFDASAFDRDPSPSAATAHGISRRDMTTSADFIAARQKPASSTGTGLPLTEVSGAQLNKSPSPPKQASLPGRAKSDPYPGHVVAKADTMSRGPCAPPQHMSEAEADNEACSTGRALDSDQRSETLRQQARAFELQALSSRLSDLIPSAAASPTNPSHNHSQPAAARPRRRQILGRAISNASNGSSAASDGTAPRQTAPATQQEPPPPPPTQLQYADPEAMQMKEAIMSRMMGDNPPAPSEGRSLRRRRAPPHHPA